MIMSKRVKIESLIFKKKIAESSNDEGRTIEPPKTLYSRHTLARARTDDSIIVGQRRFLSTNKRAAFTARAIPLSSRYWPPVEKRFPKQMTCVRHAACACARVRVCVYTSALRPEFRTEGARLYYVHRASVYVRAAAFDKCGARIPKSRPRKSPPPHYYYTASAAVKYRRCRRTPDSETDCKNELNRRVSTPRQNGVMYGVPEANTCASRENARSTPSARRRESAAAHVTRFPLRSEI